MSFKQIGFLETTQATARWALKYHQQAEAGVLALRAAGDDAEIHDLPILAEWRSMKGLLSRIRTGAAPLFGGATPRLGRAWIEVVPPYAGTPWSLEAGDYADVHVRTRTCLIPAPGAVSFCGAQSAQLGVGWVHAHDPRLLASEANLGDHARVHLVVDVERPASE